MNRKANKPFIRWCILGAVGCGFMAAGDWLLGCIPLQQTDTGLFNRAYYLSGSYGLCKTVLTVGLGAIGGFLYYFVVKALNADIDEKYRKTRTIQFLCGIFTVAIALTIHTWVATWMSVMSQSSTNSAIMVWCIAAAVYERKRSAHLAG